MLASTLPRLVRASQPHAAASAGSVAAAEIGDIRRLLLDWQIFEIRNDRILHLPEKTAVLRCRAENVQPAIKMPLMSLLIALEHGWCVAKEKGVHLSKHRPVRQRRPEFAPLSTR